MPAGYADAQNDRPAVQDPASGLTGRTFAGFLIQEKLGAGGMGVVYRAVDPRLGRSVALKFLSSVDAMHGEARERFLREARAASALDHPNIATVYGIEESPGGELCIVMGYYEGETLAQRLAQGPLTLSEALRIAIQVAEGLVEAHAHCVIHRDIKPSNILLTRSGAVKIVDFGLATCACCDEPITKPNAVIGTAAYMSPEQARGMSPDPRADVWSLGAVLYEMLSGRRAFQGNSTYSVLHAVVHKSPDPPQTGFREIDRAVLKALEKAPADRYASMREFCDELKRLAERVEVESSQPTLQVRIEKPPRRRPALGKAAALAAAVALGSAALWFNADLRKMFGGEPAPVSLAVLPFSAGDAGTEALARGLAESLSSRVAALERYEGGLVVIPAAELASRQVTTVAAAQKAAAATVTVAGTLQRVPGGTIELQLEFHDARTGEIVRGRVEDSSGDAGALEQRAAGQIAALLDLKAAPQARASAIPRGPAYEGYLRGLGYLQRWDKAGNLDEAIAAFTAATRIDAQFAPAWAGLAEAARTRFRSEKDAASLQHARNYAEQAVRLAPDSVEGRVVLGRTLQDSGERERAVAEFEKALERDPRHPGALIGMARTYEEAGRVADAETTLRRAVSVSPYAWAPRNNLAAFYIRQKRYHDAEAQYRRAMVLTPDNATLHSNLGVVLARQDRTREALESFRRSVELGPSYAAYVNIGNIHYRQRQYAQAAAAYDEALQLNGNDFRVWGAKAQALRLSGGDAQATEAAYRHAIRLAERELRSTGPRPPRTESLLAVYYAGIHDAEAARRAAAAAVAHAGADREVLLEAATAYALIGDRASALRWAQAAVSRGSSWSEVGSDPDLAEVARAHKSKG